MTSCRNSLFLAACLASSAAAGGSSGSSCGLVIHTWFTYHYEYFHLENWILACLVLLTIVFEYGWHHLLHYVEHLRKPHAPEGGSHGHGKEALTDEEGLYAVAMRMKREFMQGRRKTLYPALTERCAGELMVLGFLAWGVWTFARSGFFYELTCSLHLADIGMPHDAHGYQETVEDVHIHLFLGMVCFILVLTVTAYFLQRKEEEWKVMNDAIIRANRGNATKNIAEFCPEGIDPERFKYFFKSRVLFSGRLACLLAADEQEEKAERQLIIDSFEEILRLDRGPQIQFKKTDIPVHMGTWFPFNEFASEILYRLVEQLAEVKLVTWFYLAGGLIISALGIYLTHSQVWHWVTIVVQLLLALAVGLTGPIMVIAAHSETQITAEESQIQQEMMSQGVLDVADKELVDHTPATIPSWVSVEGPPLFSLQMFIFYFCYNAVRLFASNYWWYDSPMVASAAVVVIIIAVPLLGYLMAQLIARFALVLARGDIEIRESHLCWVYGIQDQALVHLRKRKFLTEKANDRGKRAASREQLSNAAPPTNAPESQTIGKRLDPIVS